MSSLIPIPDAIPVNWWWFQVLLLFTFLIHLLLMNFMLGGSLLTLYDLIRKKNPTEDSQSLPTLVALTINFGVPPLLFVQVLYGHLFYSSSILMAVPWIMVIPILILAYYGAHIFSHGLSKSPQLARISLGISAVLLLVIAFIQVNNNTLMLTPDKWVTYFDHRGGASLNWREPTLFPRYLHFIIGAIAIAGLGKAAYYKFKRNMDQSARESEMKEGLKIFGWVTVVQMGIGTWFWLSLPSDIWRLFMGKNLAYTALMVAGWLLSLLILHSALTNRFWLSVINGLLAMAVMVIIRDLVRHAYLNNIFSPKELQVTGEISPLIAFLAIFAIGLFSLYYMVRLLVKSKTE
ncbi:MAG: hypothetical protein ACOYOS_23615 [Syntrophales bacterium]